MSFGIIPKHVWSFFLEILLLRKSYEKNKILKMGFYENLFKSISHLKFSLQIYLLEQL